MEILSILIPLSVALALVIGVVLWWAVRNEQFEDLDAAGQRILLDDDRPDRTPRASASARSKCGARTGPAAGAE